MLAAEYVTTFGKDIIIVNEESEKQFVSSIEKLLNPEAIEANLEHQSEVAADTEVVVEEAKDLESLLERQIALLVGKKVTSPIFNRDDQLLIAEGTILTRDLILSVHEDGPSGMVELSMNVETI